MVLCANKLFDLRKKKEEEEEEEEEPVDADVADFQVFLSKEKLKIS
jgi:hypothetical protein